MKLEQNQSFRTTGECVQGGFYFHPSDENLSPETPVEEKAAWLYRFRPTPTLILLYPSAESAGPALRRRTMAASRAVMPPASWDTRASFTRL